MKSNSYAHRQATRRADAKFSAMRAKKQPTLDDDDENGDDNAHKTYTANKCAGRAGPYCVAMSKELDPLANSQRAGLTVIVTVHWQTNPNGTHRGVALKRTGKNHMMLNYCPWCGANIAPERVKK